MELGRSGQEKNGSLRAPSRGMLSSSGEKEIPFVRLWPLSKRRGWGGIHRARSLRAAWDLTPPAFAPQASASRSCEQQITLHSLGRLNREAKRPGSQILRPSPCVCRSFVRREPWAPLLLLLLLDKRIRSLFFTRTFKKEKKKKEIASGGK